jgi:phage-related protein
MAVTTFSFFTYNNAYSYDKWDVLYGAGSAYTTAYFYSTVAANLNAHPLERFYYVPTQTTRLSDEVMRVSFTQTGTATFRQGSMVLISGVVPDGSANYTGVALGGGAGYVDFLCAGLTTTNGVTAGRGGVVAPLHPNWTTGFWWIPGYTTDLTSKQLVVNTPLGDGYSQRFNPVINSNSLAWGLVFDNRTDKEARSLLNFLQDKGGATPFVMPFPVGKLTNRSDLKYIAGEPQLSLSAFGLNSVTVPVQQVFDL